MWVIIISFPPPPKKKSLITEIIACMCSPVAPRTVQQNARCINLYVHPPLLNGGPSGHRKTALGGMTTFRKTALGGMTTKDSTGRHDNF